MCRIPVLCAHNAGEDLACIVRPFFWLAGVLNHIPNSRLFIQDELKVDIGSPTLHLDAAMAVHQRVVSSSHQLNVDATVFDFLKLQVRLFHGVFGVTKTAHWWGI